MKAVAIVAILLFALPIIPISAGGEASGTEGGTPAGRSLPALLNSSLDISFEKSEYIVWNLTGNMTINITFTSKSASEENVSVSNSYQTYSGSYPSIGVSSDLDKRMYLLFSSYEAKTLQVNLSVKPASSFRNGQFIRLLYVIRASNGHIQSQNFTTISNIGPYSVKIISPAPSMGVCHAVVDTLFDIWFNVTNHSDGMLDGTIQSYGRYSSLKKVSVGPKSSAIINLTVYSK